MKNQLLYLILICVLSVASNPLTAQVPPSNDDCTNPRAFSCNSQDLSFTTDANPIPDAVPLCGAPNTAPGVWYSFTADQLTATAQFEPTFGLPWDIRLSVFSGTCGNLSCVESSSLGDQELVFPTLVGENYLVLIHGFDLNNIDSRIQYQLLNKYTLATDIPDIGIDRNKTDLTLI